MNEITTTRALFLRRERVKKITVYAWRVAIIVALFALWEIAAQQKWIDAFIMSSPSRILTTINNLYISGELFYHIGVSCWETVVGFVLGTAAGTVIAFLLWWSPLTNKILEPYLVVLNSLPKIALGPIFIVWLGAGSGSIIAITLAISLVVTVLEVLHGFSTTDSEKLKLVKTMGANKLQSFWFVVLPANIPCIVNSLKINVGLSWVGVIVGEFLVSRAGLGYLIVYGSQVFKMDLVMASVIILAVIAAVMYQGVMLIQRAIEK